jgi:PIN domain nuclease of toxin-antitoxin system
LENDRTGIGWRMNYLLDTHVIIWMLCDTKKLSRKVIAILQDGENKIFISAVSLWEISIKFKIGKLEFQGITPDGFLKSILKQDVEIISLDAEMAATYYQLESLHKDPFDLMLAWQAMNYEIPLISKDTCFNEFKIKGLELIW